MPRSATPTVGGFNLYHYPESVLPCRLRQIGTDVQFYVLVHLLPAPVPC